MKSKSGFVLSFVIILVLVFTSLSGCEKGVEKNEGMLESFEDGNVNANPEWKSKNYHWEIEDAGGPVEIGVSQDTPDSSKYSGEFRHVFDDVNAAAQYAFSSVDTAQWQEKGINAIRLWFKGDPDNPQIEDDTFRIELRCDDDDDIMRRWGFDLSKEIQNVEWKQYTIRFDEMYITKGIDDLEPENYVYIKELYFGSQFVEQDVHYFVDNIEVLEVE